MYCTTVVQRKYHEIIVGIFQFDIQKIKNGGCHLQYLWQANQVGPKHKCTKIVRTMRYHGLMKSAFFAALLLLSNASAYDKVHLLRGASDGTSVEVEQYSKHDLGKGEHPHHQDATSADAPLRQLAGKRRPTCSHCMSFFFLRNDGFARTHLMARQRMKGNHPSHRAPPGSRGSRHSPHGKKQMGKKQMMHGGSHSSTRWGHWVHGDDDWAPSNIEWVGDDGGWDSGDDGGWGQWISSGDDWAPSNIDWFGDDDW